MDTEQTDNTLKRDIIQVLTKHGLLPPSNASQLRVVTIQFHYNPIDYESVDSLTESELQLIDELCGLVSSPFSSP